MLMWHIDAKGNHYADAPVRRYTVGVERLTASNTRWQVRVDGYPIGHSATLKAAQRLAQTHCDR